MLKLTNCLRGLNSPQIDRTIFSIKELIPVREALVPEFESFAILGTVRTKFGGIPSGNCHRELDINSPVLLVKPDIALSQMEADKPPVVVQPNGLQLKKPTEAEILPAVTKSEKHLKDFA